MEFALIGGALLLMLGLRKRPVEQQQQKPPPERAGAGPDADEFVRDVAGRLKDLVPGGAIIGAGLILSKATGDLGAWITQDQGSGLFDLASGKGGPLSFGRITGELNSVTGTGINVGRGAGREIDKALGGGDGATRSIAEAGGGAVAGVGSIFGALAAASFFFVTALVYAVGSIVSDLNRLSYGQKGATEDYGKEWSRVESLIFRVLTGEITPEGEEPMRLAPEEAMRISWPLADGVMLKRNRLAFSEWMGRGRGFLGLGTTDSTYHAQFGMDRGYFVGQVSGGKLVGGEPAERSLDPHYFLATKTSASDSRRNRWVDAGGVVANIAAYRKWMSEGHGFGVDDRSHAGVGIKEGRFEALSLLADGAITCRGLLEVDQNGDPVRFGPITADWRDKEPQPKPTQVTTLSESEIQAVQAKDAAEVAAYEAMLAERLAQTNRTITGTVGLPAGTATAEDNTGWMVPPSSGGFTL